MQILCNYIILHWIQQMLNHLEALILNMFFSLLNDDYKDEFKKNNTNDCVSHSKDQIIYVLITFDTLLIRTQFELPFAH